MPTILQNHYVLAVHDLAVSENFYVDVLGFAVVNKPPGWVFVKKDNCMIMIGECRDALAPVALGDHNYFAYLVVDDADAYHAQIKGKAELLKAPRNEPWGMREFGVKTPDGHRIMIGHRLPA